MSTNDPFHDCSGCGRSVPQCECDDLDEYVDDEDACMNCDCFPCVCEPYDPDDLGDAGWPEGDTPLPRGWWGKRTVARFYALCAADPLGRGRKGTLRAMALASGGPLGGSRRQRRANRRRAMQTGRKWSRETGAPW